MEFLKSILSQEAYDKLAEELKDKDVKLADLSSGDYVKKTKYDTALADLETVKAQLSERDNDLEELKKSKNYKDDLDALQAKYTTDKEEWANKLKANERNAVFEITVAKTGVIDPVALKAHTKEFADKAELKDGELVGLTDHIKGLLGGKLSYLVPKDGKGLGKEFSSNPGQPEVTKADQILAKTGLKKE